LASYGKGLGNIERLEQTPLVYGRDMDLIGFLRMVRKMELELVNGNVSKMAA